MKKAFSLILSIALLVGLCIPVLAFQAQLSAQKLTVDGIQITCEKYNIDGSNYFKLRDLAKLLDGTESQFDVGWDAAARVVSITTNHAYTTATGTELVVGKDQSASAQPSKQTIKIDGAVRADLSVYNIGGNNYFKLRELGDALGFDVDYIPESNTATVESRKDTQSASETKKVLSKVVRTDIDGAIVSVTTYSYDSKGKKTYFEEKDSLGNLIEYAKYDGKENIITLFWIIDTSSYEWNYSYNDLGQLIIQTKHYSNTTYQSDNVETRYYFYDTAGNCIKETWEEVGTDYSQTGTSIMTYDNEGKMMTDKYSYKSSSEDYEYGGGWFSIYSYDTNGNMILEDTTKLDGSPWYTRVYTYDDNGNKLTDKQTYDDGKYNEDIYTYDSQGNILMRKSVSYWGEDSALNGTSVTTYAYDQEGQLIKSVTNSTDDYSEYTYEYITINIS